MAKRLIDLDETLNLLGAIHNNTHADFTWQFLKKELKRENLHVEAIPIEWIEGQIKMYDELSDIKDDRWGDIYHTFAQLLRGTIARWRKENGKINNQ